MSALPYPVLEPPLQVLQVTIDCAEWLELEAEVVSTTVSAPTLFRCRWTSGEDILVCKIVEGLVARQLVLCTGARRGNRVVVRLGVGRSFLFGVNTGFPRRRERLFFFDEGILNDAFAVEILEHHRPKLVDKVIDSRSKILTTLLNVGQLI